MWIPVVPRESEGNTYLAVDTSEPECLKVIYKYFKI